MYVEVGISRQNYRSSFWPTNGSTFCCLELSRRVRHLAAKVGTVRILYRAGTISLQVAVYPDHTLGAQNMKEEEEEKMSLGSTQPLKEMSTRCISWG